MCAKHAAKAVSNGVFGYRVVQISAIFPYSYSYKEINHE
jgi:hypothetical protein